MNPTKKLIFPLHSADVKAFYHSIGSCLYSSGLSLCKGVFYFILLITIYQYPAYAYQEKNWTDEQVANAIRKTEGVWTYGIKTIKCSSENSCRTICLNTIKNNRKRYKQYGYKKYPQYLEFLQSRYCPTASANLSPSEKRLNHNWLRLVRYFLNKEVS